mmetsp:Transcript_17058/g.33286  ORF Transcript_17058/g.33286 Transcript_17058/m.33286 type:complete len:378 (+) Transcript_17058:32-1165(+)
MGSADESKARRRVRHNLALPFAATGIALYGIWLLLSADSHAISPTPALSPAKDMKLHLKSDPPVGNSVPNPSTDPAISPGAASSIKSFAPGSLSMTRAESMKKCWVDPKGMYRTHFGDYLCVVSESQKMVFYHVRKSGSSTGREVATKTFGGRDMQNCKRRAADIKNYYTVAFVRNPITRFFASYEEMFVRTLGNHRVPKQFDVFHADLENYKAYERIFCGPDADLPRRGQKKPCDQVLTRETGELAHRFERFVKAWDGTMFEQHLGFQAPVLSSNDGKPFRLDFIGDTKHTDEHWQQIGKHLNVPKVEVIRGRAYPRRMNITYIQTETYERICRLAAIDFCCLNFELPPQCANAGVSCEWEEHDGEDRIVPRVTLR